MKSQAIGLRPESGNHSGMLSGIIFNQPASLHKSKILHLLTFIFCIAGFGQSGHFFIKIPKCIVLISFIVPIRSRLSPVLLLRTPTLGQPPFFRIQFFQTDRLIQRRMSGQTVFQRFSQKQSNIIGSLPGHIKMSTSRITQK